MLGRLRRPSRQPLGGCGPVKWLWRVGARMLVAFALLLATSCGPSQNEQRVREEFEQRRAEALKQIEKMLQGDADGTEVDPGVVANAWAAAEAIEHASPDVLPAPILLHAREARAPTGDVYIEASGWNPSRQPASMVLFVTMDGRLVGSVHAPLTAPSNDTFYIYFARRIEFISVESFRNRATLLDSGVYQLECRPDEDIYLPKSSENLELALLIVDRTAGTSASIPVRRLRSVE